MEDCPHDLYRSIMQNPSPTPKRTALIRDRGRTVAVAGLRRHGRHWEPALHGVVLNAVMPALPEYFFAALAALRVDIWVRYQKASPASDVVRVSFPIPTYQIDCNADFDAYWKQSGLLSTIKKSRRRAAPFTFEVDAPGSAAWTINNWSQKWRDHPARETVVTSDLLLAAAYLQPRGKFHSFWLKDGDTPIAGRTLYVDGNDLVGCCTYYSDEYRRFGVGIRIFELSFKWATTAGYARMNLGGDHAYKGRWAPEDGAIWNYNIAPSHIYLTKKLLRVGRERLAAVRGRAAAPLSDDGGDENG
jgi:hypothetical protein